MSKENNKLRNEEITLRFRKLLEEYNMKTVDVSRFFNIPYETVRNWYNGSRVCSLYVIELMEYKLKNCNNKESNNKNPLLDFHKLLEEYNIGTADVSRYFNIPYKTVRKWYDRSRVCSSYILALMEYKLRNENN